MRKWSQPTQRNRMGQLWPQAATFDGSWHTPYGTLTSPFARLTCSESSSDWALRQTRLPFRSNCRATTRSTASRRRSWLTR